MSQRLYIYNCIIKQLLDSVFAWKRNYQGLGLCYPPQPSASADNTNLGLDNSRYHAQPHPIIAYYHRKNFIIIVQTLLSLYKLYYHRTNFIIIVQTLLSLYKLYYHRTNFIIIVQTLLSLYKLYYHRTNFIIIVQTLLLYNADAISILIG